MSVHPITFKDFDIQLTVSIVVKGSDYFASDWEHDEEAFRKQMVKEATAAMRNADFDISDCWLDHIEEVDNDPLHGNPADVPSDVADLLAEDTP